MCLCCPQNCLISSKHDRVTKYLEGGFTTFIDLDFKPLMFCFVFFNPQKRASIKEIGTSKLSPGCRRRGEPLKSAHLGRNK